MRLKKHWQKQKQEQIPADIRTPTTWLADGESQQGSATVAMVFLAASVIVGSVLANLAVSVAVSLTAVDRSQSMTAAIEQRYGDYLSQMDAASGTSPIGPLCYSSLNTCVSVTVGTASGGPSTVSLSAVYGNNQQTLVRSRTISPTNATNIAGFDAAGNPVWVSVPGVTAYGG